MNRLLSFVLLCMLATAGCQSSPDKTSIAQTQAAQVAFLNAVAAAQTQAAPPIPTATPPATIAPGPTETPPPPQVSTEEQVNTYLSDAVWQLGKRSGAFFHASLHAGYKMDSAGNPNDLFVGVEISELTGTASILRTVSEALAQTYSDPESSIYLPPTLTRLEIVFYIQSMARPGSLDIMTYSGDWANVVALGDGRLSYDQFASGLNLDVSNPYPATVTFWTPGP